MSLSRRMRRLLSLALGGLFAASALEAGANLTRAQARLRASRVERVEYEVSLDLEEGSDTYGGVATVRFRLERPVRGLFLDFQGEELLSLKVNGREVPRARVDDFRIDLPRRHLWRGDNVVQVEYRNAYDTDGAGLHKSVDPADGNEYLYTQFEPFDANRLFPCFDQPDLKATYQMTVAAPARWEVLTNAPERSSLMRGEKRVWTFQRTERFSTYIAALCAGPFASWTDPRARIPSRIFVTQSMQEYMDPEEVFEVTRQGFDFFERYFRISYPFGKYDQIFVPQFNWGAMENVGCVIFNDRMVYRHDPTWQERMRRANTVLHEMAHMWFGDIVTMEWWNDLWLNESFATYMAYLGLVEATKFTDAWESFAQGTKAWAYWQDQLPTTHPIETPVPDTDTTFTNFDGITYGKGASVLKQLAFYVGEEAFREGVSEYLKANRWGNARREDFIASIGRAAGLDMNRWTRLWLQTSGVNTLMPEVEVRDGRVHRFWIEQEPGNGDAVLRPHRLQVALHRRDASGALALGEVATVRVDGARTRVQELEGAAAPDFVDANHGDHAFAKVFLDERSLAFAREHMEDLPSSFLRSMVWRTLWFMVRDAAMPAPEYLDLFLEKGADEAEEKLVGGLLRNVESILGSYLPEGIRPRWVTTIHALAWEKLRSVEPGSDLQKVWFSTLVDTAETSTALERLVRLLEGRETLPGFDLDQEKRWDLVTRLCLLGHPRSGELLGAEEGRDPSERGQKSAYAARVALPDPASKAEAWEAFVSDGEEAALDLLRAGMRTFFHRSQPEVTAPYVERYFEVLPDIDESRGNYYAQAFAGRLFPGHRVTRELLARSERALAEHPDLPAALRRELLEQNDELERALRIRALAEER